jgi:hypothetical protein
MTAVADVDAADLPSAVATMKAMMDPKAPIALQTGRPRAGPLARGTAVLAILGDASEGAASNR